ncbi:hypothetical protein CGCSCA5_v000417 [Colletotrichum siamense]|nr:hypothetical protein CGCSCA5_v000417 [Colletotrichum siamense]
MSHYESSSCHATAANGWKAVVASLDYLPTYNVLALPEINVSGVSHCGRTYLQPPRPVPISDPSFGPFLDLR